MGIKNIKKGIRNILFLYFRISFERSYFGRLEKRNIWPKIQEIRENKTANDQSRGLFRKLRGSIKPCSHFLRHSNSFSPLLVKILRFSQTRATLIASEVRKNKKKLLNTFPCIFYVYKIMFNTFFDILELHFRSSNCK